MQLKAMHRDWQFDAMAKNLVIADHILTNITDESVFSKRDGGDGWTISEVLGHLADYELIFQERVRLTIEEDNPLLPAPDQDNLVKEHGFADQDALDVFKQWQTNRAPFLDYLKSLPDDDRLWERPARHPRRGDFTLGGLLLLFAWHDTNHIHQIIDIINQ